MNDAAENAPETPAAPPPSPPTAGGGSFPATQWSVVLRAGTDADTQGHAALEALCRRYWYPLYTFVCRQGRAHHEAEDCVQEFIAQLLAHDGLQRAHPDRGRFRTFLLAGLSNFLTSDWRRSHAAKRGGGCTIISWEDQSGEDRYLHEPCHDSTPEKLFEQSWALTVIEKVMEQLRQKYTESGKVQLFEAIRSYLAEEGDADTYAAMAATMSMTEGAVKMAVLRLRESFRHELREEIAQTVADPAEIDEELRHLFASLGR